MANGLLYVGHTLGKVGGNGVEPALINPHLPIQSLGSDEDIPYWPKYDEISPAARGAYLRWLASGRSEPGVNIGLIFLYFYGLERRILSEQRDVSDEEWQQIHSEVIRLLEIYGQNLAFRRYANAFLEVLSCSRIEDAFSGKVPEVTKSWESRNLRFKVGLGSMVQKGQPISADWALALLRSDDSFNGQAPATRCRSEFEKLFAIRYRELFGQGLILKPNNTPLKAIYKPASPSFHCGLTLTIKDIPEVTVSRLTIERLSSLAQHCSEELDPYSRYLGRNPDSENSPAALVLLPPPILDTSAHPVLVRIRTWVRSLPCSNGLAVTSYAKLREVWPSLPEPQITKRDAVMISQCLSRIGYGIEPDIRFGAHLLAVTSRIVLFALPADSPLAPSAAYRSATLQSNLGAAVAHADDQITIEEEQALMDRAGKTLELLPSERLRLQAYTKWLLLTPVQTTRLSKRVEQLPVESRAEIGNFLAGLVAVDGHIAPSEISVLRKLYRQLGLDPQSVSLDAHAGADEPMSVQAAEPPPTFAIPIKTSTSKTSRPIDLDKVRRRAIESDRVSALLREIFVDEEVDKTQTYATNRTLAVSVSVLDLDDTHSRFVLSLLVRDTWTRAEIETMAATHSLMPDGAIDTINEASLNLHGEPLLEGEDPVNLNFQVRSVIQT